jgi:MFS transporter, DHA2 family, multidrug resistance protein
VLGAFGVAALVEDPPWVAERRSKGIDFIGIGLITLGLGALQVVMDRGEDEDWFGSPFIRVMALLAFLGIAGAVGWLLTAKKPVVNLHVMGDRNFSMGVLMISAMGFILYASAVIIPQFAQQVIGYNATLAGLILSPGGFVIILLIPFVSRALGKVPTRYLIMVGFTVMGCSLVYSSRLTPDVSFMHLALLRASQTAGLAFMFVPISTIAYATLPKELNGDASALFTMFRNVSGSIGISAATATVTQETQIRQSYLSAWTTPLNQPFNALIEHNKAALLSMGRPLSMLQDQAMGQAFRQFRLQAQILAYGDVFLLTAFAAFAIVPFTLLFTNYKPPRGAAPAGGH